MIIKLHRLNKRWLYACVHPWLTSRTPPHPGEFLRPNSQVSGLHVRAKHHQPGRVLSATVTYTCTTTAHVQNLAKKIMKRRMLDGKIKKNNSNRCHSFKISDETAERGLKYVILLYFFAIQMHVMINWYRTVSPTMPVSRRSVRNINPNP